MCCAQTNENISPGAVLKLAKELRKLSEEPLDGIKIFLNEDEVTDSTAELRGPGACVSRASIHAPACVTAFVR